MKEVVKKIESFYEIEKISRLMKNEYQISTKNMTDIISIVFFIRTDKKVSRNS